MTDERKAAEEWARKIARYIGADFLPATIGENLTSTKLAAMEAERLRADLADVRVKLDRANGLLECALVVLRPTEKGSPLVLAIYDYLTCIPRKERAS